MCAGGSFRAACVSTRTLGTHGEEELRNHKNSGLDRAWAGAWTPKVRVLTHAAPLVRPRVILTLKVRCVSRALGPASLLAPRHRSTGRDALGENALTRKEQAEQEGFEPSVRLTPHTGLAIRPLKPLGHRSQHARIAAVRGIGQHTHSPPTRLRNRRPDWGLRRACGDTRSRAAWPRGRTRGT